MKAKGYLDLLIPRGGAGLIQAVVENATVPVIETGTGIVHIYVDKDADQDKALAIIENAKTSRPSVCNAMEVLLVHEEIAAAFLPRLQKILVTDRDAVQEKSVELRLDEKAAQYISLSLIHISIYAQSISVNFAATTIIGPGFIALAAMIFGKWDPIGAMLSSLFFGLSQSLAVIGSQLPFLSHVPAVYLQIAPYVLTILVLAVFFGKAVAPKADGINYIKSK